MKMTDPDHIIAIMQAYKAGKIIQCRQKRGWINQPTTWSTNYKPFDVFEWNFNDYEYRVKPEPREFWLALDESTDTAGFAWTKREKNEGKIQTRLNVIHVREVEE